MSRGSAMNEIRLPSHEEPIPAITILDGQGRVVRVVPANEFRRGPMIRRHAIVSRRRGGRRMPGESAAAVAVPGQSL
jgi:hypothetical protein